MADQIGELGLGTGDIEAATDRVISQLTELGKEAVLVTGNLAAMALVVGGTLAKGIYETRKEVERLNEAFQDIRNTNAFSESLTSVANLESRIKSLGAEIKKIDEESIASRIFRYIGSAHLLGGEGFDKSEADQSALRAKFAKEQEDLIQRIGKHEEGNLRILQLQKENRLEEAEILKSNLAYNEKIAKAIEAGQGPLAVTLAKEKEISEELIRQRNLKESKESQARSISAQAEDAARQHIAELENQQKIKDEQGRKEDRAYEAEEKAARDEEIEDQKALYELNQRQTEEAAKRTKEAEKILQKNKEITAELQGQSKVISLQRSGNQTAANREAMEQDFERKIRAERANGNEEGAKELEKQRNAARAGFDVEESKKTPRQRAAERRTARKLESDEAKAKAQNEDLDDRLDRGAKGDKGSRLEQRRAERAERAGHDAASKVPSQKRGWDQADRSLLQQIRDSLQNKDG